MLVQVVIPVHNEAENIEALVSRLDKVFAGLPDVQPSYLFVDDGSNDHTLDKIMICAEKGSPAGYLELSRNYGHQAALEAGIVNADGDVVITLDGDLQHPPEEIPNMLKAYAGGYDIVHMVPNKAVRGYTRGFYRFFKLISNSGHVPVGSDFRLMSRRVVEVIKNIPEQGKIIRVLSTSLGFRQQVLNYQQDKRHAGSASYSLVSLFFLALNMIFNYTTFPLRLVFYSGLILAILSFLFGAAQLIMKLMHGSAIVTGYTDIIVSLTFLSGSILLAIGIIGRYLESILEQVRQRPSFIVKNKQIPHVRKAATTGDTGERR